MIIVMIIVMQNIEKSIFQSINHLFWFRYVDDIIACVSKDSVDDILMTINSINASIQFTKETEVNSTINYLDMSIIRQQNGTLEFKVFRKNTHTDRYLNFNSYHPTKYKRSTARSLFCRANKICDERFLSEENKHIAEALRKNNYPACVIRREEIRSRQVSNNSNPEQKYYGAPYIRGTSERTARILKKFNITLGFKSTKTVKNIVCKLKDRKNNLEKAGVVYKIECKDCESNYVGETGRCLQDRINKHKKDVRKKNERSNIYQHVRNTGHEFKFEEVKVLDEEANAIKRRFLEGVHTLMNRDTINRALDISLFFHPMLMGEG